MVTPSSSSFSPLAWVDGRCVPIEEARVPLEDRGFLFGEAVYEAMLTRGGRAFALEPHLLRLERSAEGAAIDPARFRDRVRAAVDALLAARPGDGLLYLQVTGGAGPRDHLPPDPGHEPGVYATLRPYDRAAFLATQARGIRIATAEDPRWGHATWKTTQLLGNVLAKRDAADAGAGEVVFIDAEGHLLEGASTNLFVVSGGVAITPPLHRNILAGITRSLLLEHCADRAREADLDRRFLDEADEVFIASTTRPVLGVVEVDGRAVGDGGPGPVTRQLGERFQALMDADLES